MGLFIDSAAALAGYIVKDRDQGGAGGGRGNISDKITPAVAFTIGLLNSNVFTVGCLWIGIGIANSTSSDSHFN